MLLSERLSVCRHERYFAARLLYIAANVWGAMTTFSITRG
jgi:hypothetical protein